MDLLPFLTVCLLVVAIPGVDMALVTQQVLVHGRRAGLLAVAGVVSGSAMQATAATLGLSALLAAAAPALAALKAAGAVYLLWLGLQALRRARRPAAADPVTALDPATTPEPVAAAGWRSFRAGLLTNLLNPKIGVFYVALLPQFLPAGSDPLLPGLLLAAVHAALTVVWFALLIGAASLLSRWLRRPGTVRAIDGVTGATLVGFGMRLALSAR